LWYITGVKNIDYEKIIDNLIPPGKGKALDLGCGKGFYSEYLKEKGYFTIGIDNNEDMLKEANGKYDQLFNLDIQKKSYRFPIIISILY
jgi:predicted TPR repeat methyltransferase